MPTVRFELTISAGERPQTYALDRAATRTGDEYGVGVQKSRSPASHGDYVFYVGA
jgi:hypothetical protein